jgi:CHAT domain-containing protein
MLKSVIVCTSIAATFSFAPPVAAATPLSVLNSFRIGTSGTTFCSAQSLARDAALVSMFDGGYSITCRDAVLPVGRLYRLRDATNASARLAVERADTVTCAPARGGSAPNIGALQVIDCKLKDANVGYRAYQVQRGRILYAAEGLAGYDSVIQLGLRSLIADQPIKGEISIATTGVGDPAAFARVQAGTLDPSKALSEAYRRNNVGSYSESAEFFAAVTRSGDPAFGHAEALANEALQKSNLGRYAEADSLFSRAAEQVGSDPLVGRRLRNYRAMHLLNQGKPKDALAELDKPVPTSVIAAQALENGTLAIDAATAKKLNAYSALGQQLGNDSEELLPAEKQQILDAQALQLRGSSLRLTGDFEDAAQVLRSADSTLQSVRGGKVTSIIWMRAQILGDLAAIAEEQNRLPQAEQQYRAALALVEANYPGSAVLLNTKAQLAGYLARHGQYANAELLFGEIVHSQADATNMPPSLAQALTPYVDILLKRGADPVANANIFLATQLMMRPGLAQTQAVLARELSGGTDEGSRLFRQSVALSRQVERTRVEISRIEGLAKPTAQDSTRAAVLKTSLDQAQREQLTTQAALSSFPRYRAVSDQVMSLGEFQKVLRPGEAYYRMTIVGDQPYAMLVAPGIAKAVKLDTTAGALREQVDSLRDTISKVENGQRVTYAFDVGLSHQMYTELFGPFDAEIAGVKHLIFEPDGAMLRLPPNLLVMDQASVDAYKQRAAAGGDSEFDFRGINWLGRDRDISTSVSPRSFADLRSAPPSSAPKEYLGLGQNTPPAAFSAAVAPASADRDCVLPISSWMHPISARELQVAAGIVSSFNPRGVQIITGDGFTDTGVEAREDLDQYRIIHFATHGVVTARAAKCAAQPALLTSFGGRGSDGLLTFRKIFDLHLDADLVILSACDTAGKASVAATEQAGLSTGGDVALDGLVRAFVGAGGRLVIASHWPVPDDFNATQRLITGLFSAPPGTPTVTALRLSQRQLMDEAQTSHPFYWSAFAAIGDGEMPVIRAKQQVAQAH